MSRHHVLWLAAASFLLRAAPAAAAPQPLWSVPANVRVVQYQGADNVRVFSDVAPALASITDASEANPYLVKVMPGTFYAGDLKPFVTIEGSGIGVTTLRVGAVYGTIRNATVTAWGSSFNANPGMLLDHVDVVSTYCNGFGIQGPGSARIVDSTIRQTNPVFTEGVSPFYAIAVGGALELIRSRIETPWYGIVLATSLASVTLVDSTIVAGQTAIGAPDFDPSKPASVIRSSLEAPRILDLQPHWYTQANPATFSFRAVHTRLAGDRSSLRAGIDRLFGCYDETLSPIPDL
jgi:hypothetical protein